MAGVNSNDAGSLVDLGATSVERRRRQGNCDSRESGNHRFGRKDLIGVHRHSSSSRVIAGVTLEPR
jgi:hypothetical protein